MLLLRFVVITIAKALFCRSLNVAAPEVLVVIIADHANVADVIQKQKSGLRCRTRALPECQELKLEMKCVEIDAISG